MEKEIVTQVMLLLEQSKDDQFWTLIVLFFGVVILNLLQAIYTARIIDKYRNNLKRQEVKFSVYNQIRIEKLSELFELAHEMKCASASIVMITEKKEEKPFDTEELVSCYERLSESYSKNRYIFPSDIKENFSDKIDSLNKLRCKSVILSEKYSMLCSSDYKNNPTDLMNVENLQLIEDTLGDYDFRKGALEAMLFCERLKVKIEEHFVEWE
ncbi:hypothetical protein LBY38_002235 [Vibrio vulnificus]|nr:hypothetical protein [Vibrio vulnificus]